MTGTIAATEAKAQLHDGAEIALLDVREAGQFGEGHPLFAVPCPYSRLEIEVPRLAPRKDVRILLIDNGEDDRDGDGDGDGGRDGVAARAAARLARLGYRDLSVIERGAPGWAEAGFTLYKGVNVPSKTLGELAEHAFHPATVDAATVARWQDEGRAFRLFDARPPEEYARMRVPGAVCLPNGELAHRWPALGPGAGPLVVTCAGRTRGITGVLGLAEAGLGTGVMALENGTQGWALAGGTLERDNDVAAYPALDEAGRAATRYRADALLARHAIPVIGADEAEAWRSEPGRTTYLLDVRSIGEVTDDPAPAFTPAPSGQLVQATDRWVGVRHAQLVLLDDIGLRAGIAALWLKRLGYRPAVARIDARLRGLAPSTRPALPVPPPVISAEAAARDRGGPLLDLRSSRDFVAGHCASAVWATRPRLGTLKPAHSVRLIADEPHVAALAALDLADLGYSDIRLVDGGHAALARAGVEIVTGGLDPKDAIDHLWFVHDRHDGNLDASRRYLKWEQGLVAQLDPAERAEFRL